MRSIRLNNKIREEILTEIKIHVEKEYKKGKNIKELQEYKEKFARMFYEKLMDIYGDELRVFKKWKLGYTINSFYLKYNDAEIEYHSTNPFHGKGYIFIDFKSDIFIPLSKGKTYSSSYNISTTVKEIIKDNPELTKMLSLMDKIHCDIETEKNQIISAYKRILNKYSTTKKLLNNHPSLVKYINFLRKDEIIDLDDSTKLIQKFETETE